MVREVARQVRKQPAVIKASLGVTLLLFVALLPVSTASGSSEAVFDPDYIARQIRPDFPADDMVLDSKTLSYDCGDSECPDLPLWPWHYTARDEFICPSIPLGRLASDRYTASSFSGISVEIDDILYDKSWVALCVYQDDTLRGGSSNTNGASVDISGNKAELWVLTFTVRPDQCLLVPCMGSTGNAQYTTW